MSFFQFVSHSKFDTESFLFRKNEPVSVIMDLFSMTGAPCAVVCDEVGSLLGTVTDGDIRKGLRSGLVMSNPIHQFMNPSPLVLRPTDLLCNVKAEAIERGIDFFPCCDRENVVTDIYRISPSADVALCDYPFVVMAGGFGKRMGELTANTPKPLLSIKGKSILERIIDQAISYGFHNIFITVHFEKEQIKEAVGDGSDRNISIQFIEESEPLGTAGGLFFLPEFLGPFCLINGDIIGDIDYRKFMHTHIRMSALATIGVYTHQIENPFGVVEIEDTMVQGFREKPIWSSRINGGVYIIDRSMIKMILDGRYCDINTFFEKMLQDNRRISAFDLDDWADVGDPKTYLVHR